MDKSQWHRFDQTFLSGANNLNFLLQEIMQEITVYQVRLRKLADKNKELSEKDTIPADDKEKLANDVKRLELRLDNASDDGKAKEEQ